MGVGREGCIFLLYIFYSVLVLCPYFLLSQYSVSLFESAMTGECGASRVDGLRWTGWKG